MFSFFVFLLCLVLALSLSRRTSSVLGLVDEGRSLSEMSVLGPGAEDEDEDDIDWDALDRFVTEVDDRQLKLYLSHKDEIKNTILQWIQSTDELSNEMVEVCKYIEDTNVLTEERIDHLVDLILQDEEVKAVSVIDNRIIFEALLKIVTVRDGAKALFFRDLIEPLFFPIHFKALMELVKNTLKELKNSGVPKPRELWRIAKELYFKNQEKVFKIKDETIRLIAREFAMNEVAARCISIEGNFRTCFSDYLMQAIRKKDPEFHAECLHRLEEGNRRAREKYKMYGKGGMKGKETHLQTMNFPDGGSESKRTKKNQALPDKIEIELLLSSRSNTPTGQRVYRAAVLCYHEPSKGFRSIYKEKLFTRIAEDFANDATATQCVESETSFSECFDDFIMRKLKEKDALLYEKLLAQYGTILDGSQQRNLKVSSAEYDSQRKKSDFDLSVFQTVVEFLSPYYTSDEEVIPEVTEMKNALQVIFGSFRFSVEDIARILIERPLIIKAAQSEDGITVSLITKEAIEIQRERKEARKIGIPSVLEKRTFSSKDSY